ncbi:MAG TPA: hypothetical protein VI542_34160, partial [Candidatus Tectomicrobia bacterium]
GQAPVDRADRGAMVPPGALRRAAKDRNDVGIALACTLLPQADAGTRRTCECTTQPRRREKNDRFNVRQALPAQDLLRLQQGF